jgi:3-deoxy-7-phosphoheptulonate synthase
MIVKMTKIATEDDINCVVDKLNIAGYGVNVSRGSRAVIIIGTGNNIDRNVTESLSAISGVEKALEIATPFKLASRQVREDSTIVSVKDVRIGGGRPVIIAGPCAVETREQLLETATAVKGAGAHMLRGGAYKPRTSPYDFQGLGIKGLEFLRQASIETGLPVVTEVMSSEDIDTIVDYADLLQVGARNMQNFHLLRRLGKIRIPVLLKRGPTATIREFLLAAEYILDGGNENVVLCERGIRTFETEMRNTLDLAAVARIKELSHLPVIVDPSHATGRSSIVPAVSRAALAVGADGLLIEVHPCPEEARSDGFQSLNFKEFENFMQTVPSTI